MRGVRPWPARVVVVVVAIAAQFVATGGAAPTGATTPPTASQVLASLSLAERVGQLLMLGVPSTYADAHLLGLVRRYHVGSAVLIGDSTKGVTATARVTRAIHAVAPAGIGIVVAVDQEGGAVQRLRGPGFDRMPSALTMGGWTTQRVRRSAARWGGQLRQAGVTVDLAPVLDVVPLSMSTTNLPIGSLHREFGHTPRRVAAKGGAFAAGLAADHLGYALKHFPGLGRVRGNTDTASGVTDAVTTRHDAYLAPFAHVIAAHAPVVMVASATYLRIDRSHPAVFSRTVVTGMLRHDLGFAGVVISDSLSGAQLARWTPASRAVQFIRAGGDLALTTSAADLPAMYDAILRQAREHAAFRALVDQAALRVLRLKRAEGLLTANPG